MYYLKPVRIRSYLLPVRIRSYLFRYGNLSITLCRSFDTKIHEFQCKVTTFFCERMAQPNQRNKENCVKKNLLLLSAKAPKTLTFFVAGVNTKPTSFPESLFSASLSRWNRDPGNEVDTKPLGASA